MPPRLRLQKARDRAPQTTRREARHERQEQVERKGDVLDGIADVYGRERAESDLPLDANVEQARLERQRHREPAEYVRDRPHQRFRDRLRPAERALPQPLVRLRRVPARDEDDQRAEDERSEDREERHAQGVQKAHALDAHIALARPSAEGAPPPSPPAQAEHSRKRVKTFAPQGQTPLATHASCAGGEGGRSPPSPRSGVPKQVKHESNAWAEVSLVGSFRLEQCPSRSWSVRRPRRQ